MLVGVQFQEPHVRLQPPGRGGELGRHRAAGPAPGRPDVEQQGRPLRRAAVGVELGPGHLGRMAVEQLLVAAPALGRRGVLAFGEAVHRVAVGADELGHCGPPMPPHMGNAPAGFQPPACMASNHSFRQRAT